MPDDTGRLVDDLRGSISDLANSSPLVAPAHALASLGDHVMDAKDTLTKHALALKDDISARVSRYLSPDASASAGRDIELPRDPKTARSKPVTRPRSMSGGKR